MIFCFRLYIYISAVSVYATKTYWEVELQFHSFLNLALGRVSGQFYTAPALGPEGITKDTGFYLRAGGPESLCGRFGEGRQPRTSAEIRTRPLVPKLNPTFFWSEIC
jgi:hypothetical protein